MIDARGLAVAPGFIDVQGQSGTTLLADGNGESHLRQGITTEIIGEGGIAGVLERGDGGSASRCAPFGVTADWTGLAGYFERLRQRGIAVNLGTLVPATMVRREVIGLDEPDRRRPRSSRAWRRWSIRRCATAHSACRAR